MAETYSVRVTPQAQAHLREIRDYIRDELCAPEAAIRLMELMKSVMGSLSSMPARTPAAGQPVQGKTLRRIRATNFRIYFWIDEPHKTVHIIAVLYGKRDQGRALNHLDF